MKRKVFSIFCQRRKRLNDVHVAGETQDTAQRFLNMAPKTSSGYPVPKSTAPPLEPHRALPADPSDPRELIPRLCPATMEMSGHVPPPWSSDKPTPPHSGGPPDSLPCCAAHWMGSVGSLGWSASVGRAWTSNSPSRWCRPPWSAGPRASSSFWERINLMTMRTKSAVGI